ncbi:MAG TPA: hypothetical protein VF519_08795 [Mycobacteriales bacterium]|jgi:hypothetical protein
MKRTLHLRKEVLADLGDTELAEVVGAVPPPTIPYTACTICSFLATCPCG